MNAIPLLLALTDLIIALNEKGKLSPEETQRVKDIRTQLADAAEKRIDP